MANNFKISGDLDVSGNTTSVVYYGDGSQLTGIPRGGGSGGQVYYLNISNTQSPYYELSRDATNVTEQMVSASVGSNSTQFIAGFLTKSDSPGITNLPDGILSFYLHCYDGNNHYFDTYCEFYKRSNVGNETLLFTSDPTPVIGSTVQMVITDGFFSGATISTTDRLLVKIYATNLSNQTRIFNFVTEGTEHYSFVLTTIPSGIISISSGSGITASTSNGTATITNTDKGSSQNIFKNIQIGGVTQFSAGSNNSSLNFSGINISISSASTNTLVFSSSTNYVTGSGTTRYIPSWNGTSTLNNTIIYNATDKIGINTALPLATLHVSGNSIISGTLTATTISATTYQNLPFSGTVTGSGTLNYLPKWTSTTGLGNSQIIDDGNNIGIGTSPSSPYKINISDDKPTSINISSSISLEGVDKTGIIINVTSIEGSTGISSIASSNNGSIGVYGESKNGNLSYGVKGVVSAISSGGITTGIGGYFASDITNGYNPTNRYSVQLIDGTEGTNKVLISTTSDGKANWSDTLTGLTNVRSTTISATTYQNLPTDIRTTGASYSNNTFTFTNNTGGTYSVLFDSVTGLTVNGGLTVTGNTSLQGLTATTISATTYQNIPIKYYKEFSGAPTTSPIVLGTDSISIGNGAESRSTYMLSFGTNAGKNATGTTVSNFIGSGAGYDASGSTYVNFIGGNAGYGAINANSSTFLNTSSGNFSTGATYSNFFGTSAGESSKDLNYSNVLGYQAGLGVTNAQYVNYFGRQSGWYAINATFSNFIGFGAGTSATNASYSNFIGSNAGTQASNASFSNLIGFNAGKLFTGNNIGSNNIIIGTNLSLPNGATNSINIGGVLFGTGTYSNTGTDPLITPNSGKIGINVVNPSTTLDVNGTTRITGGLTASSITSTGATTLGSGSFTKNVGSGDIAVDNGSTDTPGLLMYYANNANWGIDSNNQTQDVLSGQLFRIVNKLNETGGAVKMAMDTTGNAYFAGFVKPSAWRAGQVVNDIMLSNTEVTVSTTTIATSTSDTDFVSYSYTPLSSSSYLVIHYHLGKYDATAGTGNDSWYSRIKVDGSEIIFNWQTTVNGFRSGTLFPLTGRYTNSSTTAKSIVIACRRDSADDSITITNSSTSMWLRITEIAR